MMSARCQSQVQATMAAASAAILTPLAISILIGSSVRGEARTTHSAECSGLRTRTTADAAPLARHYELERDYSIQSVPPFVD